MGDKEDGFIEERRSLLDRFIRECAKFEFILESQEFKIFSRQTGEVGETLEKLGEQTPGQILDKYRLCFKISEESDNSEVARYREKINIFQNFLTKAILSMNVSPQQLIFLNRGIG
jgi:sorting nexin-1/2